MWVNQQTEVVVDMERGQSQRTQLDHELWKVVCQDTGLPLKLDGWEGSDCTEGLQNLCDVALDNLKHTLPKWQQQQLLDEKDTSGTGVQAEDVSETASGADDASGAPAGAGSEVAEAAVGGDGPGAGTETQDNPIIAFKYRIDKANSAFQNLKEFAKFSLLHCGVQQPLCTKSTQQAIERLKAEYRQLEHANQRYSNYLKIVDAAEQLQLLYKPESSITPEQELAQLKRQIAERKREIQATKALRQQVQASSAAVERKMAKLQGVFERTVQQLRVRETSRYRLSQIQQSLCTKIRVAEVKAYHLKRTNIFNDCFFIWHEGPFATINGNRLGRLPTSAGPQHQVDYPEINAAWGCAALLLHLTGAYHASKEVKGQPRFEFKEYDIRPMGSNSTLVWRSKNKPKELFSGGCVRVRACLVLGTVCLLAASSCVGRASCVGCASCVVRRAPDFIDTEYPTTTINIVCVRYVGVGVCNVGGRCRVVLQVDDILQKKLL